MLIDCDDCVLRGLGCSDCVVTVLLGTATQGVELDEVECQALAVLADGGLVPPLRLARRSVPESVAERVAGPGERGGEIRRRGGRARCESGELSHRGARHAAG